MPYIIDGHNLIGRTPGLDLSQDQDEARLLAMLRRFSARSGKKITVYFDRRAPGAPDPPSVGGVQAIFVRAPRTADQAIEAHLRRLAGEAHNWTVVSSDRAVQRAARRAGARVISSEEMARALHPGGPPEGDDAGEKPGDGLPPEEVAWWETFFRQGGEP